MKKKRSIFVVILIFLFLTACDNQSPSSSTKAAPSTSQTKKVGNEQESSEQKVWPYNKKDDNQQVTDLASNLIAKNYILIFDGSGSMEERKCTDGKEKIEVAKEAVTQWSTTIPEGANLGLIAFYNEGWIELPLTAGPRDKFVYSVDNIFAGGGTPLSQAIGKAYNMFLYQGKRQLGYGEYTIVIVTDGIANDTETLSKYINYIIEKTPINIYSIGFCIGEDHSLNQKGRTVYKSADNPEQLKQGLKDVLAESETFDISDFN